MKISVQALGDNLKSHTQLKLLDMFFLHYFTIFCSQLSFFIFFVSSFWFWSVPLAIWDVTAFLKANSQMISGCKIREIIPSPQHELIIGYICPGQTASANVNRKCDPGRSLVNRRKHLQQFCQKSQINFMANKPELKRDLGTVCLLFTCLKYLGEKIKYLIIIF